MVTILNKSPTETPKVDINAIADKITSFTVGAIIIRTNEGKDVNGNNFIAYANSYKKQKTKPNKNNQSRGSTVNLVYSGNMVNSVEELSREVDKDVVLLTIGPSAVTHKGGLSNNTLGYIHNEGIGKQPKREWVGLTKQEQKDLLALLGNVELIIE